MKIKHKLTQSLGSLVGAAIESGIEIIPRYTKSEIFITEDGNTDVIITCPKCDNSEEMGADEQRHHLGTFNILEWKPDEEGKNEVSNMQCKLCQHKFELEWDYQNIIED